MPVAFFSLEMSKEGLSKRLHKIDSRFNTIRDGECKIIEHAPSGLQKAFAKHPQPYFWIDDTASISTCQLRESIVRLKRDCRDLRLVFIDYLQLMQPAIQHKTRPQEIAAITSGLKEIAIDTDTLIIALAQVSRLCEERSEKRPLVIDLEITGLRDQ